MHTTNRLDLVSLLAVGLLVGCGNDTPRVPESHFVQQTPGNKSVVIFVHGVIGDMDNTWINETTGASWPAMLAEELPTYDVFVYGYLSPKFGQASSINELAVSMHAALRDQFFSKYDRLYFITHSMGGIVTKRALNIVNTTSERADLQKVRMVIYVSVPAAGASIAQIGEWAGRNPQFKGMNRENAKDFLRGTEDDWRSMALARTPSTPFPKSFVAYETRSVGPIHVVEELYTSKVADATPLPFDYNHKQIVKPDSKNTRIYRWAKDRILEVSQIVPAPDPNANPNLLAIYAGNVRKTACEYSDLVSTFTNKTAELNALAASIQASGLTQQNLSNVSKSMDRLRSVAGKAQLTARDVEDRFEISDVPPAFVDDQRSLLMQWKSIRKSFEDLLRALPENLQAKPGQEALATMVGPEFTQALEKSSNAIAGHDASIKVLGKYSAEFQELYTCTRPSQPA